jgi:hypothetical protein
VYQLGVLVHVLSAIVWIGGMLFLALVGVPAIRGLAPDERARLFDAIQVDPRDTEGFAGALKLALELPTTERRRRMDRLRAAVRANTVYDWAAALIEAAAGIRAASRPTPAA